MLKKEWWNGPMTRKNWFVVYCLSSVIGMIYLIWYICQIGLSEWYINYIKRTLSKIKIKVFG